MRLSADALADPAERTRRLALLGTPHMAGLVRRVATLDRPGCTVPWPDPCDGGADARVLLLLEKPGARNATGFVSRDNPTGTARAIRSFLASAGVPRRGVVIWNAVPWWNGTARVSVRERVEGAAALLTVVDALPRLEAVVTAGATATVVFARSGLSHLAFAAAHPSPNVRAAFPDRWAAIGDQIAAAASAAGLAADGVTSAI